MTQTFKYTKITPASQYTRVSVGNIDIMCNLQCCGHWTPAPQHKTHSHRRRWRYIDHNKPTSHTHTRKTGTHKRTKESRIKYIKEAKKSNENELKQNKNTMPYITMVFILTVRATVKCHKSYRWGFSRFFFFSLLLMLPAPSLSSTSPAFTDPHTGIVHISVRLSLLVMGQYLLEIFNVFTFTCVIFSHRKLQFCCCCLCLFSSSSINCSLDFLFLFHIIIFFHTAMFFLFFLLFLYRQSTKCHVVYEVTESQFIRTFWIWINLWLLLLYSRNLLVFCCFHFFISLFLSSIVWWKWD